MCGRAFDPVEDPAKKEVGARSSSVLQWGHASHTTYIQLVPLYKCLVLSLKHKGNTKKEIKQLEILPCQGRQLHLLLSIFLSTCYAIEITLCLASCLLFVLFLFFFRVLLFKKSPSLGFPGSSDGKKNHHPIKVISLINPFSVLHYIPSQRCTIAIAHY